MRQIIQNSSLRTCLLSKCSEIAFFPFLLLYENLLLKLGSYSYSFLSLVLCKIQCFQKGCKIIVDVDIMNGLTISYETLIKRNGITFRVNPIRYARWNFPVLLVLDSNRARKRMHDWHRWGGRGRRLWKMLMLELRRIKGIGKHLQYVDYPLLST